MYALFSHWRAPRLSVWLCRGAGIRSPPSRSRSCCSRRHSSLARASCGPSEPTATADSRRQRICGDGYSRLQRTCECSCTLCGRARRDAGRCGIGGVLCGWDRFGWMRVAWDLEPDASGAYLNARIEVSRETCVGRGGRAQRSRRNATRARVYMVGGSGSDTWIYTEIECCACRPSFTDSKRKLTCRFKWPRAGRPSQTGPHPWALRQAEVDVLSHALCYEARSRLGLEAGDAGIRVAHDAAPLGALLCRCTSSAQCTA